VHLLVIVKIIKTGVSDEPIYRTTRRHNLEDRNNEERSPLPWVTNLLTRGSSKIIRSARI